MKKEIEALKVESQKQEKVVQGLFTKLSEASGAAKAAAETSRLAEISAERDSQEVKDLNKKLDEISKGTFDLQKSIGAEKSEMEKNKKLKPSTVAELKKFFAPFANGEEKIFDDCGKSIIDTTTEYGACFNPLLGYKVQKIQKAQPKF